MAIIKLFETEEDFKNNRNFTVLGKCEDADALDKANSHRNLFNYDQYIAVMDREGKLLVYLHREEEKVFRETIHMDGISIPVEIEGDKADATLFGISKGIVCQQVNCQNRMGSGLAKAIMDKYPAVAESYHKTFHNHSKEELFGSYQIVQVENGLYVANIYSQFDCGNAYQTKKVYTDVDKLIGGIMTIAEKYADKEIYVPVNIGCGLGGEDWNKVSAILRQLPMPNIFLLDTMQEQIVYQDEKSNHARFTEKNTAPLPDKGKAVCFTGGRPKSMFGYNDFESYVTLKENMKVMLRTLIKDGYTTFITGGAQGFDQLACRCIIDLKKEFPDTDIKNVVYVPYKGQENRWTEKGLFSKEEYRYLLEQADEVKILSDSFSYDALFDRNIQMVNDADLVIAYYEDDSWKSKETKGGTASAMRYAFCHDKPIMQIYGKECAFVKDEPQEEKNEFQLMLEEM